MLSASFRAPFNFNSAYTTKLWSTSDESVVRVCFPDVLLLCQDLQVVVVIIIYVGVFVINFKAKVVQIL